jgi:hypothetical protein
MNHIKKQQLLDLDEIFNDEVFSKKLVDMMSNTEPYVMSGETVKSYPTRGYFVQCYCEYKDYDKLWKNIIHYMTTSYTHISLQVSERDVVTIENVKKIEWNYEANNEYGIVKFNGNLNEDIENYVTNNGIDGAKKLIWFCIKLKNEHNENELTILPVYSGIDRVTTTIRIVNDEQLAYIKSIVGEDIFISRAN